MHAFFLFYHGNYIATIISFFLDVHARTHTHTDKFSRFFPSPRCCYILNRVLLEWDGRQQKQK